MLKNLIFIKKMSKSDCYLMQHLYAHAACNLFSDLTAKYNLNNNASIADSDLNCGQHFMLTL